jgi:L-asparagine transporter-like permease
MPGAVILMIVLGFPIIFGLSMAGVAALFGHVLWKDGEIRNEGSELLDLNT